MWYKVEEYTWVIPQHVIGTIELLKAANPY